MYKWFGGLWRSIVISTVLNWSLMVYGFGRIGTLFVAKADRPDAIARLRGRVLRRAMTTLGSTFIKLGQVMSTRPDLLAAGIVDELRQLQDRLPPGPFKRVKRILEEDLGPIADHFAELDEVPVAAASVAQVHRARLKNGDEVAVKVLRTGVREQVERDGRILMACARIASAISANIRATDPVGHLDHFLTGILAQTDLRLEAKNYEAFRTYFADTATVRFPKVYPEHSATRVLTMEFLRGKKIDALGPGDHRHQGIALRDMFLKMTFEDGFLHADLHPGNMLVCDDGRVAVFDVGLVVRIEDHHVRQIIDLAKCMTMGAAPDFVNHLREFHTYLGDVDWTAVTVDAEKFALRFRGKSVSELEWGSVINDMFAIARNHRIRPLPEMALVFVGIVTAEGIGKMLNPNGNSFQEMAAFILPLIHRKGLLAPTPVS